MASLIAEGKQQYFSNAGLPLVGGKLYTYIAGTTTPKLTYTDADGTNPNTNPIILDARGEATVFWSGSYKVELRDALDNVIWTVDKVTETNLGYRTSSTGSAIIPAGTTAQRDAAPVPGYFRYNVDNNNFEGYYAAAWRPLPNQVNGVNVANDGNILLKTVGGVAITGAGDIAVQAPLVSGTNIKTLEGVTLLGAGDFDLKTVGGVSLIGPGNILLSPLLIRSTRVANTILAAADLGTFIDITAGTFSQTFTAAATLADGWWCYIRNSGTGDITLDPNGAELIDGLATYIMYPGECRLVQCSGTAFTTIVLTPFEKTFTASGTFTKPPGYTCFEGEIWNGGNSGAKSSAGILANAGAGGGAFPFQIPSSFFGVTESITIGAGGTAIAAASTPGNVGGISSIGTLLVMTAATAAERGSSFNGAIVAANQAVGGFEGNDSAATPIAARVPWGGSAGSSNGGAASGNALYGGAAGGSIDGAGTVRAPGTSKFGGNGGAASVAGSGTAGSAPGGGGGGTQTGATSGAGARGELRIRGV